MKLKATIWATVLTVLLLTGATGAVAQDKTNKQAKPKKEKGWITLFDGKSFNGWKMADENQNSWSIQDGAIVAHGERSHLYYVGDDQPFVNFELKVEAMTTPGSNGGIYIHTQYQEKSWPKYGYEVQVNQTHTDWRKTGSLYAVKDVKEQLVKDNEWYTYHIIVQGKRVIIKVNGQVAVDWTEEPDRKPGADFTRVLDKGTFALQAHDPKSTVRYRNIRVKRLG